MTEELVSPIVNEDRSVTFNFKSENAKKVEITGFFRFGRKVVGLAPLGTTAVPMEKTSHNIWTYTTESVLPGIYAYSFIVDGVRMHDPLNPSSSLLPLNPWRRWAGIRSMVKVEDNEPMPWNLIPNIQHGTVAIEKFYSEIIKRVKHYAVYLPSSYRSTRKKYPVLFLLHGAGGDYTQWVFDGNIHNIMDYLISKGRSKEIIVVMPDGWATTVEEMKRQRFLRGRRSPAAEAERKTIGSVVSDRHVNCLVNELMPFIESRYRVLRGSRAIAGLSMGGGQTFNVMISHPDMFTDVGMFSSGGGNIVEKAKDGISPKRPA